MLKFELYNNVGEEITIGKVKNFLNSAKGEDIQFDISTLGGDLATAITIHDLIKTYPGKTVANIVGLTASAGTVIAIACDDVQMSDNSLFLIHNGWKEVTGNVYDFEKAVVDMRKTDSIMVKMYREKTNLPDDKIISLMKASDWLSPHEAQELGFIDRVTQSGMKIAASALIEGAQGQINNSLLIKLKEKMKLFGKEKASEKAYPLAFADGGTAVINAEEPAAGVEIAPLGAMTLEDGEYELADGRRIIVAGGAITEVMEKPQEPQMQADQVINTVAEMLTQSEAKISALIEAKLKPLAALSSKHKPVKTQPVVNTGKAEFADTLQAKIEARQAELKAAADKKRKGV